MIKLESKRGAVNGSQEKVYNYITDFRNFSGMLPEDKLRDLEISNDELSFGIDGLGTVGLMIAEKNPFSVVNIKASDKSTADFKFTILISEVFSHQSEVQIKLEASLNMMLEMMAKGPLQQFIDLIVDKLATVNFDDPE